MTTHVDQEKILLRENPVTTGEKDGEPKVGEIDRKEALLRNLRQETTKKDLQSTENRPKDKIGLLDRLIFDLKRRLDEDLVPEIKHPQMLLDALTDMNKLIGMEKLKEAVSLQVMRLIEAIKGGQNNL